MKQADYLIIGSGIAGLSLAIRLAKSFPEKQLLIVCKSDLRTNNTAKAQGGIASTGFSLNDSFEKHIQDTINAGDGLCDIKTVEKVAYSAPERIKELIELGVNFDQKEDSNQIDLSIEGGHSEKRVLHYKDKSGAYILEKLINRVLLTPNILIQEHCFATELIKVDNQCCGAYLLKHDESTLIPFFASNTIVCTGGGGALYEFSSNPKEATADGIALGLLAEAKTDHLAYIQFHPTILNKRTDQPLLISECVRGAGAFLINEEGKRFMKKYSQQEELACRDLVSRAIEKEINLTGNVYLDCRHIRNFHEQFPQISEGLLLHNIDPLYELIPVTPATHYFCGGISVDEYARTNLKNLFAIGEVACTGLHGANRLASNSLLEAVVYSHSCWEYLIQQPELTNTQYQAFPSIELNDQPNVFIQNFKKRIQSIMSLTCNVVRTNKKSNWGLQELKAIESYFSTLSPYSTFEYFEVRNMILVAKSILTESLTIKENRGTFFNEDLATESKLETAF